MQRGELRALKFMTNEEFEATKTEARRVLNDLDAFGGRDRQLQNILYHLEHGCKDPRTFGQFTALLMLEDLRDISITTTSPMPQGWLPKP